MAQASLTRFYQTRRNKKADLKGGKLLDQLDDALSPVIRETSAEDEAKRKLAQLFSEPKKAAPRSAKPAAVRKPSKSGKTPKSGDIRGFFAKSATTVGETPSSQAESLAAALTTPKKRPSSPSTNETNLETPKRSKRNLIAPDVDEAIENTAEPVTNPGPQGLRSPDRAKTKGKPTMSELKAKMAALKEKTNAFDRRARLPELSPDCKTTNTLTFEVPASPSGFSAALSPSPRKRPAHGLTPKKLLTQPQTPKKLPAHARLRHLLEETPIIAEPVPASTPSTAALPGDVRLDLPVAYNSLLESFKALDIIVFMLMNRRDVPVYFEKVKGKVRELSHRAFTELTVARIKAAFPDAYDIVMEEIDVVDMGGKKKEYHLILRPNFGIEHDQSGRLGPSILRNRLLAMEAKLFDRVHEKHEAFLASLKPPATIARDQVRRWHPEFPVESLAGIDAVPLPKKPAAARPATARDILGVATRNLFEACPRIVEALEKASGSNKTPSASEGPSDQTAKPAPKPPAKPVPKDLMKFNSKLLEKIRAKEAAKNFRTIVRSEAEEKKLTQLKRLPDLAKIIQGMFIADKKSVVPLTTVVERVSYSYSGALSQREIREHIELMADEMKGEKIANAVVTAPPDDWIRIIVSSDNVKFVRLYKQADINVVVNTLRGKVEAAA